jgi:hypothetical protein
MSEALTIPDVGNSYLNTGDNPIGFEILNWFAKRSANRRSIGEFESPGRKLECTFSLLAGIAVSGIVKFEDFDEC